MHDFFIIKDFEKENSEKASKFGK